MKELGIGAYGMEFEDASARDREYVRLSNRLVKENRAMIEDMRANPHRSDLSRLEADLADLLIGMGFIEVKTPTIISKRALANMTVTEDNPLYRQVFFIDDRRCLRPMLAPNLYSIMRDLGNDVKGPVRFFEIGSCFRKESHSSDHLEEFTMLNLVELRPEGDPTENLERYMGAVMGLIGLEYELVREESDVYKETIDVEVDGKEVSSGAVGPHHLDALNGINDPWCGAGFGLERLLMLKKGAQNIRRVSRSLSYINGARVDL